MKKLIIVVLLLMGLMATKTFAVTDSTYVTNSDTEKLIDKYIGVVDAKLVAWAESLKVPAEHVYEVIIKQQYVKAWIGLTVLFFVLLFLIGGIIVAIKSDWEDPSIFNIGSIVTIVIGLIMLIIYFDSGHNANVLTGFLNPEYGALHDIILILM